MKRNTPGQITFTVNIAEDIYRRIFQVIKIHIPLEKDAIEEIITAGLLKLKIDTVKEENASLSFQVENLREEVKRLIEENHNFEKLCDESGLDNHYIYERLEKFNAENEKLGVSIRRQGSLG
jgi:FtsZ-binding cell division protein ZapB